MDWSTSYIVTFTISLDNFPSQGRKTHICFLDHVYCKLCERTNWLKTVDKFRWSYHFTVMLPPTIYVCLCRQNVPFLVLYNPWRDQLWVWHGFNVITHHEYHRPPKLTSTLLYTYNWCLVCRQFPHSYRYTGTTCLHTWLQIVTFHASHTNSSKHLYVSTKLL